MTKTASEVRVGLAAFAQAIVNQLEGMRKAQAQAVSSGGIVQAMPETFSDLIETIEAADENDPFWASCKAELAQYQAERERVLEVTNAVSSLTL